MRKLLLTGMLVCLAVGATVRLVAMDNPQGIQWKGPRLQFVTSVYQAALGRNPTQRELETWARTNLSSKNGRWNVFWSVLGSPEYENRWGYLAKTYSVYWDTRQIDTESGRRVCHCYYVAESAPGLMPAMQYSGFPYPGGPLSFPVAMALRSLYAEFDRETCPHFDCGYRNPNAPHAPLPVPPPRPPGQPPPQPPGPATIQIPPLGGRWTYLAHGQAHVTQNGTEITITLTWADTQDPGRYFVMATIVGTRISGRWRGGSPRLGQSQGNFNASVSPDGRTIRVHDTQDPGGRYNWNGLVLRRF